MNRGTVKWFNNQKGCSFISDSQMILFVHFQFNMDGFKTLNESNSVSMI